MRKWLVCVLCLMLLSGCAAEETFETVADEQVQSVSVPLRQLSVQLPEEAAAPASESESGTIYQCDGYEIMLQTMASGDLNGTIRSISGYSRGDVTVLETNLSGWKRYDFVWASAGEQGDCIGKAAILDDGNYHYCLSVLGDADRAEKFGEVWDTMFDSIALN